MYKINPNCLRPPPFTTLRMPLCQHESPSLGSNSPSSKLPLDGTSCSIGRLGRGLSNACSVVSAWSDLFFIRASSSVTLFYLTKLHARPRWEFALPNLPKAKISDSKACEAAVVDRSLVLVSTSDSSFTLQELGSFLSISLHHVEAQPADDQTSQIGGHSLLISQLLFMKTPLGHCLEVPNPF